MNPYQVLLNLMGAGGGFNSNPLDLLDLMGSGGGPAPPGWTPPNTNVSDGGVFPGRSRYSTMGHMGRYGFPTKTCPTCGGSGVVPDLQSMYQTLGVPMQIGQKREQE